MNLRCDFEAATKVCHVVVFQPVIKHPMPGIEDIWMNELQKEALIYIFFIQKVDSGPSELTIEQTNCTGVNVFEEAWMSLCPLVKLSLWVGSAVVNVTQCNMNDVWLKSKYFYFWQFNSKHKTKQRNLWIVNVDKPSKSYNSKHVPNCLKANDSWIIISSAMQGQLVRMVRQPARGKA